jgi:plastocyanin
VQFGLTDVGTGIPAPEEHDSSFHANDTLVPGTVVIDKGGTVTFNAVGIHQIAIYKPGVEPEDIDTSALVAMPCPAPPLLIDDDQNGNREAFYADGCGPREITHQFTTPGKYLVICAFAPHFGVKMYGWVVVRNRD